MAGEAGAVQLLTQMYLREVADVARLYAGQGVPLEDLIGEGNVALAAAAGCDTYVTADVKYHQFLQAKHMGLNLIDADHFCTENVVVPVLAETIRRAHPELDVRISGVHRQPESFYYAE